MGDSHALHRYSTLCQKGEEGGFYLILFATYVLVIFVVMGLGVDIANLYFHRSRLQRATDAGCMAALDALSKNASHADAQLAGNRVCVFNLRLHYAGVLDTDCTTTITAPDPLVANDTTKASVSTSHQVSMLFVNLLPNSGIPNSLTIDRTSRGELNDFQLSLVVDNSTSMNYAANSAAFSPPTATAPNRRIDRLREATQNFLNRVGPNNRLGLVSFDTRATNEVNIDLATAAHKTLIQSRVNSLSTAGSIINHAPPSPLAPVNYAYDLGGTNISAGIKLGVQQFLNGPTVAPGGLRVIGLFTDGAPAAVDVSFPATAFPVSTRAALTSYPNQIGPGHHFGGAASFRLTWVSVTIEDGEPTDVADPERPRRFRGVILLDNQATPRPVTACGTTIPLLYEGPGASVFLPGVIGLIELDNQLKPSGPNPRTAYVPLSADNATFNDRAYIRFRDVPEFGTQNCFDNLHFMNPARYSVATGTGFEIPNANAPTLFGFALLFHRVTLTFSDWARTNGIYVYGVLCGAAPNYFTGLGLSGWRPTYQQNPYSAPVHDNLVKPILMARIANASTHRSWGGETSPYTEFFGLHDPPSTALKWGQLDPFYRGEVFEAQTGNDLDRAFEDLLQKLVRKLTQ